MGSWSGSKKLLPNSRLAGCKGSFRCAPLLTYRKVCCAAVLANQPLSPHQPGLCDSF